MEDFLTTPVSVPPQPRRSSRKWVWILVVVFLVLILVCAGIGGGIFVLVFGLPKSSPPYQMALEEVRQNPQVIQRLGEPIEDVTRFPTGNLNDAGSTGNALLNFKVAGPDGQAHVHTEARKFDGQWGLILLEVTFQDGQRLVLETSSGEGLPEAPKWSPPAGDEAGSQGGPNLSLPAKIEIELPAGVDVQLPKVPKPPE